MRLCQPLSVGVEVQRHKHCLSHPSVPLAPLFFMLGQIFKYRYSQEAMLAFLKSIPPSLLYHLLAQCFTPLFVLLCYLQLLQLG